MKTKYTVEYVRKLANKRGVDLLSKYCNGRLDHIKVRCKNNHIATIRAFWVTKFNCRKCYKRPNKYTIDDMKGIARSRGGNCLSKKYVSHKHKLRWKCQNEHEWMASPSQILVGHWCQYCTCYWEAPYGSVRLGQWCPKCAAKKRKITLKEKRQQTLDPKGTLVSQ